MNAVPIRCLTVATIATTASFVAASDPQEDAVPNMRSVAPATKPVLTSTDAQRVLELAIDEARHRAGTAAIAVVDDGGNLMALRRLDETFAAGSTVSIGKARTAVLFRKPTAFFEKVVNDGRFAMTALSDFTPLKGGVPLVVEGKIVGAIGVSGAASADEDDAIATAAAKGFTNAVDSVNPGDAQAAPAPTYFASGDVEASFSKGAVLFKQDGRRFEIHTSRRVQPGMAEVHQSQTDVIYVQSGEAAFVTGGSAEDAKPTAPDELRGKAIAGGETRMLRAGDVIVVPAGVPHWFQSVSGEFRYFVVKVNN
ncbi:MAG: heme-binding protein [Tepidisphaeraceae bacterium]